MGDYKSVMAMIVLQLVLAGLDTFTRVSLVQGLSPRVFVVYRQAVATLFMAPVAFFSRRSHGSTLTLKSFSLIFIVSFIGVAVNQNAYFEGMYLSSTSMASASGNLVPAITFAAAVALGMEKVAIRSLKSIAKIAGTVLCAAGAIVMTFLRGPKLLNTEVHLRLERSIVSSEHNSWALGCMLLVGSACCRAFWLIMQVPMSASLPDHLSLSAWMCFVSLIHCALITLFVEQDLERWKLHSKLEIACCLYAGVLGTGFAFFIQSWCVTRRGPLFSAVFNPLCTVLVTALAAIIFQEEVYIGSLAGAIGVVIGLYVVLWGKAKDAVKINEESTSKFHDARAHPTKHSAEEPPSSKSNHRSDLEEPLLSDESAEENEVIPA